MQFKSLREAILKPYAKHFNASFRFQLLTAWLVPATHDVRVDAGLLTSDFSKCDRPIQLHYGIQALHAYATEFGSFSPPSDHNEGV